MFLNFLGSKHDVVMILGLGVSVNPDSPVSLPPPAVSPAVFRDAVSHLPDPFHSELRHSEAFDGSLRSFPNDPSKLSFIVSLPRGRVLEWTEAFFMF